MEQKPRSGWDVFVMWGLVGLILLGATLTLRPFMPAILWGTVLAISLAPVQQAIMGYVGGRRRLAAALSAAFLVLLFIPPALIFTDSIALFAPDAVMWIEHTIREGIPTPRFRFAHFR